MNKAKVAYIEGSISIMVNTILFAIKMWASIVSGSIALAADAWHTLSDSLTSIIVVVAAKFSSKKPDKEHPFGHGRWEQIATIFIAVALGIIAWEFLTEAIERLCLGETGEKVNFGTLALAVTIASVVFKEMMAQLAFYLGKKHDNASIIADGWHHRSDALSSIPVLIGILVAKIWNFWWIDGVLGFIVALFLFYATYEILKETINKFLGEVPCPKMINEIKEELVKKYGNDLDVHHIHLHNYILQKELTLHIRLDGNMNIEDGHKIASNIEKMMQDNFNMTATIHIEPKEEKCRKSKN